MFLFGSKFIFSTSTTKIFMATGGQLSYFLLCSISENETDVFNFIYLNSTRITVTTTHGVFCCWINLRCDYNRNPWLKARKYFKATFWAQLFEQTLLPFASLSYSSIFQYCVKVCAFGHVEVCIDNLWLKTTWPSPYVFRRF